MVIMVRGLPEACRGPKPDNVTSLRERPRVSRYNVLLVVRWMEVPSCSVCVVSVAALAVNGAPLTTLLPCNPSKPINSMRSPNGPGPPGPPGPPPRTIASGEGGGPSCPRTTPTHSNSAAAKTAQFKLVHAQCLPFIVAS